MTERARGTSTNKQASPPDGIPLFRALRRRRWLALLLFLGVAGSFAAGALLMAPRYESSGVVWLQEPQLPVFQEFRDSGRLAVLLTILSSQNLATSVVDVLPPKAYDELLRHRQYTDWAQVILDRVRALLGRPVPVVSPREKVITELLKARMAFEPKGNTGIVHVTATASDPAIAADIATAFIETLKRKTRFFTREESQAVREFLETQAKQVGAALRQAEEEFAQYQRQRGAVQIDGRIAQSLANLSQAESVASAAALAEDIARTRLAALKAQLEGRQDGRKITETLVVPPTLKDLLEGWQAAAAKAAALSEKFTDEHPQVRSAKDEAQRLWLPLAAALQRHLNITVSPSLSAPERATLIGQVLTVAQEMGRQQLEREALQQRVRAVQGSIGALSHEQNEFARRSRAVEAARSLHDLLSKKAEEANLREDIRNVRVLDPARVPTHPSGRAPLKVLLVGIVLALGVAIGLPMGLEMLDYTMKTEAEAEAVFGWRVLGSVSPIESRVLSNGARGPKALPAGGHGVGTGRESRAAVSRSLGWWGRNGHGPGGSRRRLKPPVCITRSFDRKSPQAEQYRSLCTALKLVGQRKPFQTLLVTSLGPQEGKSTAVVNMAFLFCELGHRVLVVDGDLRRGCLHRIFGVPRSPGITDLILGKSDTLFPAREIRPGLSFVPRGSKYDKPAVLLGSAGAQQAITLFRDRAEIILIDSSPLLPVSDALNLVAVADGVLLVVKAGQCSRSEGARGRQLLEDAGANVLGLVLNEAKDMGMRGPAHYPPGYYYECDDEDLAPQPARGQPRAVP